MHDQWIDHLTCNFYFLSFFHLPMKLLVHKIRKSKNTKQKKKQQPRIRIDLQISIYSSRAMENKNHKYSKPDLLLGESLFFFRKISFELQFFLQSDACVVQPQREAVLSDLKVVPAL